MDDSYRDSGNLVKDFVNELSLNMSAGACACRCMTKDEPQTTYKRNKHIMQKDIKNTISDPESPNPRVTHNPQIPNPEACKFQMAAVCKLDISIFIFPNFHIAFGICSLQPKQLAAS